MATHSKLFWCKGGGWLIMADVSYTMLHGGTSEGGWLATLSTPPPPPPDQPLGKWLRTDSFIIIIAIIIRDDDDGDEYFYPASTHCPYLESNWSVQLHSS